MMIVHFAINNYLVTKQCYRLTLTPCSLWDTVCFVESLDALAAEEVAAESHRLKTENDARWLREAALKFPRLSVTEYIETELVPEEGSELKPISTFSPLAQQILYKPEIGYSR
jgi:hypothetical protein